MQTEDAGRMRIVAMHVGVPRIVRLDSGELRTGGVKRPVEIAVLRADGFEGDEVADRRHHGGPDRTACVYPAGHYDWWRTTHGFELEPGAFGENLTIEGAEEERVCIGDTYRAGAALVQVTLPRDPCRTLDLINGIESLARLTRESGRCGFHMRTLQEGVIGRGDLFELVRRHPAGITVADALDLYHGRSKDRLMRERLLALPELGEEARRRLSP